MQMIRMIKNGDTQARRTLLGTILIKLSTGAIGIYGSVNIYFFSYMKHQGQQITNRTNSLVIILAVIPSCLFVLLSMTLVRKIGYQRVIKGCAFAFMVFPFVINISMNLVVFSICWLMLPATLFSMAAIPVINALWTQFPTHLNKVTGLAVLSFSMGMIIWNVIFTFIVNPRNLPAKVDQNGLAYFDREVSDHIFMASNVVFLLSGACNIVGSFLVKRKQNNMLEQPIVGGAHLKSQPVGIQINSFEEIGRAVSTISQPKNSSKTLMQCLKDKKFITLFLISFLMPTYLIYIVMNMKYIYMPIIKDDHFLVLCSALVTAAAIIGAPFWAYMADMIGFKKTLVLLVAADCLIKVVGIYCMQKWDLALLFLLLSVNDKGLLTIIGPGLVQIFGVELATQLLPYKGVSLLLAYFITPFIQICFSQLFNYQQLLFLYSGATLIALILTIYFMNIKYHSYIDSPQQTRQLQSLPSVTTK